MKKLGLTVRNLSLSLFAFTAAGAVFTFACSDSSTSSPTAVDSGASNPDATAPSVDGSLEDSSSSNATTACIASAKARCTYNDTCTNGVVNKERYGDEPTCEARLLLGCEKNLAATGTGATPSTVASCAASIPGETCAEFRGNQPAETCIPTAGTVANGGPCGASAQCQSTYCAAAPRTSCGTCAPPPALGADCTLTQECGARSGLVCAPNNICVQEGAAGAVCGKDAPCGPDLTCVTAKLAASGSCVASVATANSACDHTRNTGPSCDAALGLFCHPTTDTCVAYTFAAAEAPCGVVSGGFAACTNGTCLLTDLTDGGKLTSGTCVANVADGEPCDTAKGMGCISPAKCILTSDASTAGTCTLVDPSSCK